MVEAGQAVGAAVQHQTGLAGEPVEQRLHHAGLEHVDVVLGEPHVHVADQRLGPLEAADGGEPAVLVGGVGQPAGAREVGRSETRRLLVLRRQQPGQHVAQHVVGEGRVVGERGDVEPGAPHRGEGQRGVAVAVRHEGVVVEVGVHEAGATGEPARPRSADGGRAAGLGDRAGPAPEGTGHQQPRPGGGERRAAGQRRRGLGMGVLVLAHVLTNERSRAGLAQHEHEPDDGRQGSEHEPR